MAQGKYSPTVAKAYFSNQGWFKSDGVYDSEGFDQYGYNADDFDRAGRKGYEYLDDATYEATINEWSGVDVSKGERPEGMGLTSPNHSIAAAAFIEAMVKLWDMAIDNAVAELDKNPNIDTLRERLTALKKSRPIRGQ